jgi:hypothetical protein
MGRSTGVVEEVVEYVEVLRVWGCASRSEGVSLHGRAGTGQT